MLLAVSAGSAAALPPLPSVSPPPDPHLAMRWAHEDGTRRLASAFSGGRAVVGLGARVDAYAFARAHGVRLVRVIDGLRAIEVAGPPSALASLRGVRYVEPVMPLAPAHARDDPLTYENDPLTHVPFEWAFHALGVDQALNVTKGDSRIVVGVVDSGISPVADLAGKIAGGLFDTSRSTDAEDTSGHGTLVSSIVAANNDDGFGLAGFCGACRVLVWKTYPLNTVEVAMGVRRLTDDHVRVINMSLVGQNDSNLLSDALDYALSAGVLVVAASGNDGSGTVSFPASYLGAADGGLAVGADDVAGNRAPFSNYGTGLSLVAPGTYKGGCDEGIIGAIPSIAISFDTGTGCDATLVDTHGARYAYANGTSFAAPEVAGIAALVWAAKPSLTNAQLAGLLEQTAHRPAGTGWTPALGWGVVDANAAAASASGRSTADTLRLSALHVTGLRSSGSTLTASAQATWGDGSQVLVGATPSCRVRVGAHTVATTASLVAGVVGCAFALPAKSAGALVRGSVLLTGATVPRVAAAFSLTVRRK